MTLGFGIALELLMVKKTNATHGSVVCYVMYCKLLCAAVLYLNLKYLGAETDMFLS